MRAEKEIKDKIESLSDRLQKIKADYSQEPLNSKYSIEMLDDLLEIENAIAILNWVLGE